MFSFSQNTLHTKLAQFSGNKAVVRSRAYAIRPYNGLILQQIVFRCVAPITLWLFLTVSAHAEGTPALTPQQAWAFAYKHNPTLRRLRAQSMVAQARQQGLAAFPTNPVLTLEGGAQSQTLLQGSTPNNAPWQPDIETALRWDMPIGGRWGRSQQAAKIEVDITRLRLQQAKLAIHRDLLLALYTTRQTACEVEIFRSLADFHQRIATLTLQRKNLGDGTQLEQQMALLEALQAQQQVLQADSRRLQAIQQLRLLLGWHTPIFPSITLSLAPDLPPLQAITTLEQKIPHHPSLQLADAHLRHTQAELALAQSLAIPDLTLTVLYANSMGAHILRGGIEIALPFLWRNQPAVASLRAKVLQRRVEVQQTRLRLLARLHTAHQRYTLARRVVRAFQRQIIPQLKQQLTSIEQGYRIGQIDLIRLLTARQSLEKGQLGYLQALEQATQTRIELRWLGADLPLAPHTSPSHTKDGTR